MMKHWDENIKMNCETSDIIFSKDSLLKYLINCDEVKLTRKKFNRIKELKTGQLNIQLLNSTRLLVVAENYFNCFYYYSTNIS